MKRVLTFILFLSLLAAFSNEGWVRLYTLRRFESALEDENRTVAEANEALRAEIQKLKDPRYLEHAIRRRIGFIRKDELIYEFVDETREK